VKLLDAMTDACFRREGPPEMMKSRMGFTMRN
jgi:hypothetical protein